MERNNISNSKYTYDLLKQGLNATSVRGNVIANNIANVNTKGFKKSYVTFEETLKDAQSTLGLNTTEDKHITTEDSPGSITVKKDDTSSMRTDGNNVDIDSEMTNLVANALMYDALVTQVNNRISSTRIVVDGK